MRVPIRGSVFGALIATQVLTGCSRWQVVAVSPRALVDSAHPGVIQIREHGGATYILRSPRVVGDSLAGATTPVMTETPGGLSVVTPHRLVSLSRIDRVAIRKTSVLWTAVTAVVVLSTAFFLVVGIAISSGAIEW